MGRPDSQLLDEYYGSVDKKAGGKRKYLDAASIWSMKAIALGQKRIKASLKLGLL
jgi:hypothetical protein